MDEFTVDYSVCRRLRKNTAAQRWAVARKLVLGLSVALACQAALAQAMYRIKSLGFLGGCTTSTPSPSGFNTADQVTGRACNANGDTHAFMWRNDGTPMVDLGPPKAGTYSAGAALNASGVVTGYAANNTEIFAFVSSGDGTPMTRIHDGLGGNAIYGSAINDLGQVTGIAYNANNSGAHAFLWKNNGSPIVDLGTLGSDVSDAAAINASGQVTGWSDLPGNGQQRAFVWKNDGSPMVNLGTLGGNFSQGFFINASGQVAGVSTLKRFPESHAFLWRNDGTPMQYLGTLGGTSSQPYALNDAGQVAGVSTRHGRNIPHAFVWLNDGTPMKDLGTFGGTTSDASDLNASGQVTGGADLAGNTAYHAFLWRNDGTKIQDLNTLIDPTDSLKPYVTLTGGEFINDSGDIVAGGTDSRTGLQGLYLLQGTVLTLAPRALAFGNQSINTTSATKSVTVTNTGPKAAAITSVALTGTATGQFAQTNNCDKSLAGHAICTIKVTFKPTTKGAKSAFLNVNGGGGGLRTVTLTGTGS